MHRNEQAKRLREQLQAQANQPISLEERLANYQAWLRANANAKPEHRRWHQEQVELIKRAIAQKS